MRKTYQSEDVTYEHTAVPESKIEEVKALAMKLLFGEGVTLATFTITLLVDSLTKRVYFGSRMVCTRILIS